MHSEPLYEVIMVFSAVRDGLKSFMDSVPSPGRWALCQNAREAAVT